MIVLSNLSTDRSNISGEMQHVVSYDELPFFLLSNSSNYITLSQLNVSSPKVSSYIYFIAIFQINAKP